MTAADVYDALGVTFTAGEYAILPQATQGTGFKASRWLDALVVSLWPSRGLWLHGIEIKVDRGDWRRELRKPEKGDALVAHLDYFSIAAPADVVPREELPRTWGLFEIVDGRAKEVVKPTKLHKGEGFHRDIDRAFFAGLCRRLDQTLVNGKIVAAVAAAEKRGHDAGVAEVERRIERGGAAGRERLAVEAFAEAAGYQLHDRESAIRVGKIVAELLALGEPRSKWGRVASLRDLGKTLEKSARVLEAILSEPSTTVTPSTASEAEE